MTLIASGRHSERDLAAWRRWAAQDEVNARLKRLVDREAQALQDLAEFASRGPCWVGVSWGKDSVVAAHLARRFDAGLPLVWVRVGARENPDCPAVRDAFLLSWPGTYDEIHVTGAEKAGTGSLARGGAVAGERYGDRYVSGVRAEESSARTRRMRFFGASTERTCAPIGWWSGADVFAYLHKYDLPVHPAYAMSMGGLLHRDRLRVAPMGGEPGTGHGRAEWEARYYGDVVREAQRKAGQ